MWRYDRPQRGPLPRALAALDRGDRHRRPCDRRGGDPALLRSFCAGVGVTDYVLELNSIGDQNCRPAYIEQLAAWLDEHEHELDDEARAKRATIAAPGLRREERARSGGCSRARRRSASRSATACREHFDAGARVPRHRTVSRYELDADARSAASTTTRARHSSSTDEAIGREGHDLRRRTLRRTDRSDRRTADAGHRLRRRHRAAAAVDRRGSAPRRARIDVFFVFDGGRGLRPSCRCSPSCRRRGLRADTDYAGRSVKGQLTQAGRLGAETDRDRERRPRIGPRVGPPGRHGVARRARRQDLRMSVWRDLQCRRRPPRSRRATSSPWPGWVARRRDHGGLIFIDLRDHTGIVQLVVEPRNAPRTRRRIAHDIRTEFVLQCAGRSRAPRARGREPEHPDGRSRAAGERARDRLALRAAAVPASTTKASRSHPPSLPLSSTCAATACSATCASPHTRHRCDPAFDGRARASSTSGRRSMTHAARRRAPATFSSRCACNPGGSSRSPSRRSSSSSSSWSAASTATTRSRLRGGTRISAQTGSSSSASSTSSCAFPTREEVLDVLEQVVVASFEALGRTPPSRPFPRMSYADADAALRLRQARPPLRSRDPGRDRRSRATRSSGCSRTRETVRYLVAPKSFSRGELQKLEDFAEGVGREGARVSRLRRSGEVRSPIAKFLTEQELEAFRAPPGSTVLFAADSTPMVERVLGALRLHLGHELGLIDASRWTSSTGVARLPAVPETDEGRGPGWTFIHHPFTSAGPGHEDLIESDPGAALSQHYDLVWNGWELGSGSIRIHRQEIRGASLSATMGMTDEEARAKFGWFCSTRCEWARRRTVGSPSGSSASCALLAGESEHPRGDRLPKTASGSGSAHRGTRADDAGTVWTSLESA